MKSLPLNRIDIPRKRGVLTDIITVVRRAFERSRQRHALSDLSDAQLRDIGLTRREVEIESGKPFWR